MKIAAYNGPTHSVIVETEMTVGVYAELTAAALLLDISPEEALQRAVLQLAAGVRRDAADVTSGLDQPSVSATATFDPPRFYGWHWPIKAIQRINFKR